VIYKGSPYAVAGERLEFGLRTQTLIGLPRRAFTPTELQTARGIFDPIVDVRQTEAQRTPAQVAVERVGTSWLASTRKAQTALLAWFILAEDPQRRLEVLDVAPLLHQRSLVEHVLNAPDLRRVLIADEVGLGKTVEAGLILQRLLRGGEAHKALYLAPARLVRNVVTELTKLGLDARRWTALDSDARLDRDRLVVASMQKSVRDGSAEALLAAGPWDVIVADECHHLSDWADGGGSPNAGYRLVRRLIDAQRPDRGRLLLLSGTPHQGHQARFENLLSLLQRPSETPSDTAGRVIFRTKEMVTDWHNQPLFPVRDVSSPVIVSLGAEWAEWYADVAALYEDGGGSDAGRRAGGWAKGQALQWVASSVTAGLGFLTRLAIRRLRWPADHPDLSPALAALRPYRGGSSTEPLQALYERLLRQMNIKADDEDEEEIEEDDEAGWSPDANLLAKLLRTGIRLKAARADAGKWDRMIELLRSADGEKVVLFCQPVETVEVVACEIERAFGQRPAVIIGGQTDAERDAEVAAFRNRAGRRFLVSSRAGGEGINLQISRRLIHLDIPWNPMDLEQRVGRVHRFGSRETILVNTIVVAGSREADAYRIAREKLHRIVANLAPGDFELLFSRVMSLVPPEELSGAMTASLPWLPGGEVDARIAEIVGAGYSRWAEFSRRFADNESHIRSIDPGAAEWEDLRAFLERACNAEQGPPATCPVFTSTGGGVDVREAQVKTLNFFGRPVVCDETDGLPAEGVDGAPMARVGTADPQVVEAIRLRLCELPEDRIGSIKVSGMERSAFLPPGPSLVLAYACQRIEISAGLGEERDLRLEMFVISGQSEPRRLPRSAMRDVVRQLCFAERQGHPDPHLLTADLAKLDAELVAQLREQAIDSQGSIRVSGVWPIGCFAISAS
jgi:superfamily II DNA/RNA helicase